MAYPQDPWAMLDAGEFVEESAGRRREENHQLAEFDTVGVPGEEAR